MEKIYCHSELLTVSIKIKFVIEVPSFTPSTRPYVLAMDNSTYCLKDNTSGSQGKSGEPVEASCLNRKEQGLLKHLFLKDLFLGNVARTLNTTWPTYLFTMSTIRYICTFVTDLYDSFHYVVHSSNCRFVFVD